MTAGSGGESAHGDGKRLTQATSIEAAAIAGLVFSVLSFVALALLLRLPEPSAMADVEAYYASSDQRTLDWLSLNLAVFAAVFFFWFVAVIRRRMGEHQDWFIGSVVYGSGLVYVGLMLTGALILVAPSIGIEYGGGVPPGQDVYTSVYGMGFGLLLIVVVRVEAMFVLSTSVLALTTHIFPRWLALLGFVIALVLVFIPLRDSPVLLAFPAWVALVSLALLIRRSRIETHLES